MAKIKEIVKKLEDNSYERISLGATQVSELTNDSGFITNTVSNLTNYYTKSETYTQNEIKALIDAITTLNIEVVTELPTTNISTTTIYLKGNETSDTNDYEEWIYVNNNWELIGTTAVDLSDYALKTDIPTKVSQLTNDKNYLTSIPSEYITETELNAKGYLTSFTESDPTVPSHVKAITTTNISNWNGKAEVSQIPTTTNQLTNNSGFITNTVSNLTNYYIKTEIDTMLGSVGGDISLSDPLAYEAIV